MAVDAQKQALLTTTVAVNKNADEAKGAVKAEPNGVDERKGVVDHFRLG